MPSRKGAKAGRKGAKAGRKGSRKGRKTMKRSLRFMPKLVIKERADTIEDTLNATMGRTALRIPGDITNIIQGYEGADHLYFNIDPILKKLVLSTTASLPGGGSTYINSSNYKEIDQDFVYFMRLMGEFNYKHKGERRYWPITASILLVGETNMPNNVLNTEFENIIIPRYEQKLLNKINDIIRGDENIELVGQINISTEMEGKLAYPFHSNNIYNRIIFEQIVDGNTNTKIDLN